MANKWKEIWETRRGMFSELDTADPIAVFAELKRIDGFDVLRGGYSDRCFSEATSRNYK